MNGQASFETARDTIRHEIHSQSPVQFPYGTRGTSVSALASTIFTPQNLVAISSPECTSCEYSEASIDNRLGLVLYEKKDTPKSTSYWLMSEINSRNIKVSKTLKFEQEGETVVLDVRGSIYYGDFHFTSRIVGTNGIVWYHDGMTTGSK